MIPFKCRFLEGEVCHYARCRVWLGHYDPKERGKNPCCKYCGRLEICDVVCYRFIEWYVRQKFEEMKNLDPNVVYSKSELWETLDIADSLVDDFANYIRRFCIVKEIHGEEYFKVKQG